MMATVFEVLLIFAVALACVHLTLSIPRRIETRVAQLRRASAGNDNRDSILNDPEVVSGETTGAYAAMNWGKIAAVRVRDVSPASDIDVLDIDSMNYIVDIELPDYDVGNLGDVQNYRVNYPYLISKVAKDAYPGWEETLREIVQKHQKRA